MPPVGRPRSRTDQGTVAPTRQIAVPSLQGGATTISNLQTGAGLGWNQFVDEAEFVPELMWPTSVRWYDQMRTDSQLAALYTAVAYGITQLRWIIDPNHARQEVVDGVSEDLNLPVRGQDDWPRRRMKSRFAHSKHIRQAMLALIYGHMYFEQVGEIINGKWRLRKLVPIMPRTIENINMADDGGLVSVQQFRPMNADFSKPPPEIPVDRLVGFIFEQEGANWVGRSMLRDCYKDWLIKDRLVRVDAINHERAGGVPLAAAPAGATPGEVDALSRMMQDFRVGETSGGAVPYGTDITVARATNSKVVDSISQRDEAMARRFLLMLVNLAQSGQHVGSYALGETFEDFFIVGQRAITQWYCDVMTEYLIEDWVDWNYGEDEDLVPQLTWERTSEDALGVDQLSMLVDKGVIMVDEELEDAVRYKYRLPKRTSPRPDPADLVQPGAAPGKGAPSARQAAPAPTQASGVYNWERENTMTFTEPPHVMASADPVLMTVPNVPILEVGVEYQLSTGPTTFTPEDLHDVVTAANEDPSIPCPRLGIGHIDPRFNGPEYDGTPTFGKAKNLRLSDNGMVVYADYVGVPSWLGKILPYAFPSRSIEGWWNVSSGSGKTWRFVLSACKMLGVTWPGVSRLEDLPQYYGEEVPSDVQIDPGLFQGGGQVPVTASANLDDIRRAFYNEYVQASEGARYWWVRAVMTDPNQLVVEDEDSGQLYLLPFSSDDRGNVSFGEPSAVRVDYVPETREIQKEAASHIAAALAVGHKVMATYESRASSRPNTERGGMDPKEIRRRLNLPGDATDEQVREALKELNTVMEAEQEEGTPATPQPRPAEGEPGTPAPVPAPAPTPAEGEPQPEPRPAEGEPQPVGAPTAIAASAAEDGFVRVDKATWEEIKTGAATAVQLAATQAKEKNENLVSAAISDGRVPPSRKDHWIAALKADFEGNSQVLASLEPGLIPVGQRTNGHNDGQAQASSDHKQVQEWTRTLFPETTRQNEGAPPAIMREEG